jgi:hypothetical protein
MTMTIISISRQVVRIAELVLAPRGCDLGPPGTCEEVSGELKGDYWAWQLEQRWGRKVVARVDHWDLELNYRHLSSVMQQQ